MILQGSRIETLVELFDGASPALSLDETDFVVKTWKGGETAFTTVVLAAADVVELGEGFYALKMPAALTSVLGEIFIRISSEGTNPFSLVSKDFIVSPVPLASVTSPETCVVSGNIVDIGGKPGQGQEVVVRPVTFPVTEGSSIITSDPVRTNPDAAGNFSVVLIRNQTVIIEVTRTGVRNQIIVPDQETADLLDLLPPIT